VSVVYRHGCPSEQTRVRALINLHHPAVGDAKAAAFVVFIAACMRAPPSSTVDVVEAPLRAPFSQLGSMHPFLPPCTKHKPPPPTSACSQLGSVQRLLPPWAVQAPPPAHVAFPAARMRAQFSMLNAFPGDYCNNNLLLSLLRHHLQQGLELPPPLAPACTVGW